jgi:predicted transcriptional regulator
MELAEEMRREGLTQADLARKHGISRARVNQWLSLIRLPEGVKKRILTMGDHWERRLLTERGLRRLLSFQGKRSSIVLCL